MMLALTAGKSEMSANRGRIVLKADKLKALSARWMASGSVSEKPSKPMSEPKFNACFWTQVAIDLAARRVESVEQAESLFNACCASAIRC
ncbi:hypothetical protein [Chromobacterium vaccinii]|uniref:Uncharacterized protein n=1 Tax=Chromobacterium vaccinii TaxID=1108595 RepID=A0A1D9LL92_9NEIS|nr:hypothetical protein [Chromobacterium vaccinii]AOZ52046.1 hypothetical protein BKX93_19985 [Chromobacterium vaccinii]